MFGVKRPAQRPGDGAPRPGDATASQPNLTGSEPADAGGVPGDPGSQPGGSGSKPGKPAIRLIVLGVTALAAITTGLVVTLTQSSSPVAAQARHTAATPIHLVAITPSSQATGVDGADPIIVTFSGDVSWNSPKPTLTPSVPGTWTAQGDSLVFMPTTPFQPSTEITVQVPAGASGVRSTTGGLLTSPATSQFTTASYSQAGLAILLAQQGYLPLTWGPAGSSRGMLREPQTVDPAALTPEGEAYDPPAGSFSWDAGYPATLQALWSPDQANVLLEGAVMAFESEHNMPLGGALSPQLWNALFQAQASGQQNTNGYTYAIASKGAPETLTIWHNGQIVQRSLANTGIPVSPTVDGTFPVFERFRFQIMRGTNPDGSHYADPVQYVAYFNGGDAVHYFPRGSYGWPQSLGCVELDLPDAQHAWPYLTYGSLVSVVN